MDSALKRFSATRGEGMRDGAGRPLWRAGPPVAPAQDGTAPPTPFQPLTPRPPLTVERRRLQRGPGGAVDDFDGAARRDGQDGVEGRVVAQAAQPLGVAAQAAVPQQQPLARARPGRRRQRRRRRRGRPRAGAGARAGAGTGAGPGWGSRRGGAGGRRHVAGRRRPEERRPGGNARCQARPPPPPPPVSSRGRGDGERESASVRGK